MPSAPMAYRACTGPNPSTASTTRASCSLAPTTAWPSWTFTPAARATSSRAASSSRRGATAPNCPWSRGNGSSTTRPDGERTHVASTTRHDGTTAGCRPRPSSSRRAPVVRPSPQHLSRGKRALSRRITSRPNRARAMAAAAPAGPPPTTTTSASITVGHVTERPFRRRGGRRARWSPMSGLCEGRIAIVTGAGRGIGREHALSLARHGAKVVVNDLGGNVDGTGGDLSPAQQDVQEIKGMGGEAVANGDDISSWEGAQRLINTAVETFGDLHALVNNAGILRDRMLTNMTEEEWDAVIKVHLKGTFAPSRWAAAYWREQVKAAKTVDGRIINTTSVSGIYGNAGQTNYGAAKAGIAAFTNIASLEMTRYGVTVNAVAPVALTRMTEGLGSAPETDEEREMRSPRWIAPIVTWLASTESKDVTGRVFEASGRTLAIAEGWHRGPRTEPIEDATQVGDVVADLLSKARKNAGMDGEEGTWPQPKS